MPLRSLSSLRRAHAPRRPAAEHPAQGHAGGAPLQSCFYFFMTPGLCIQILSQKLFRTFENILIVRFEKEQMLTFSYPTIAASCSKHGF